MLYNESHCLIYPSSYEGFGLPILEAMSAGCPVIANSIPSLEETGGNAAVYLESLDAEEIVGKVKGLEDEVARTSMIRKGLERSRDFSCERMAMETLRLYEDALRYRKALVPRSAAVQATNRP